MMTTMLKPLNIRWPQVKLIAPDFLCSERLHGFALILDAWASRLPRTLLKNLWSSSLLQTKDMMG